jgi:hypothetical protein
MSEFFLHWIWEKHYFQGHLLSVDHKKIDVIDCGRPNKNAGPDFLDARIVIDGVLLLGDIEIHIHSNDWYSHKHHLDPRYNRVILHVVAHFTSDVYRHDGSCVPCAIPTLGDRATFLEQLWRSSQHKKKTRLACNHIDKSLFFESISKMFEQAAHSRLEQKIKDWDALSTSSDWITLWNRKAAYCFGLPNNSTAFEDTIIQIPTSLLERWKQKSEVLYLVILKLAGIQITRLNPEEEYRLNEFYSRFTPAIWVRSTQRPSSSPENRIAQFCRFIHHFPHFTSHTSLIFWEEALRNKCQFPKDLIDRVMINLIIPFTLFVQKTRGISAEENIYNELRSRKAEDNHITRMFRQANLNPSDALASQGALHQYKTHCSTMECHQCLVGRAILHLE